MKRPQIGVLGDLVSDASNIVKVADFGLPCTQVCCWNMDFCTRDMARKVRDVAAGCGFDGDITIEREIKGSAQDRDIRDTIGYLSGILDGCCGF